MTATCPAGHTSASDDYCDVCGMPIDTAAAPVTSPPPPTDVPTQAAGGELCPNCATQNVADALFCEACGYDFTTGTMPRSARPEAADLPAAPPPLSPPEGSSASPPETPSQGAAPLSPPEGVPALTPPEGVSSTAAPDTEAAAAPTPPATAADPPFGWVAEVWIDPAWFEVQESPESLPSAGLPGIVALRKKSLLIGRKSRSRNIEPDIDCEPDTGTSRRQAQLTTDGTRWWVEDLESSNGTFVAAASDPLPEDPIPVGVKHELEPDDRIYLGAWTRIVIRRATDEELTSLS